MKNSSIYAAFERMWQHVVALVGSKANIDHAHDDTYYTEAEVDAIIAPIDASLNTKAEQEDVTVLQGLVGDTAVSTQIEDAVSSKSDINHTHTWAQLENKPFGSGLVTEQVAELWLQDGDEWKNTFINTVIPECSSYQTIVNTDYDAYNARWEGETLYFGDYYIANNDGEVTTNYDGVSLFIFRKVYKTTQLEQIYIPDSIARTSYVDENFALKSDLEDIDLSAYETKSDAQIKFNEISNLVGDTAVSEQIEEAVSSLDTIVAVDENSDGNIVLRQYIPEEDFIQVDKTLTIEGAAADAKAVGDRLQNISVDIAPITVTDPNDDGNVVLESLPDNFEDWLRLDGSNAMLADINADGHTVTGLKDPEIDTDAVSLGYLNDHFRPADAPTLKATYDEETSTLVYENVPEAFDQWLDEEEANALYAPAGYGLGDIVLLTSADDINTLKKNGWYCWQESSKPANIPTLNGTYYMDSLRVWGNGAVCYQEMVDMSDSSGRGNKIQRTIYGSNVGEWEWQNPPMTLGVEYRTTERHNGKAVYAKYYDAGILQNNTLYSLPSGAKDIVRMQAFTSKGHLLPVGPFIKDDTSSGYFAYAVTNAGANGVYGFTDTRTDGFGNGSYNMYIKLWYTKD